MKKNASNSPYDRLIGLMQDMRVESQNIRDSLLIIKETYDETSGSFDRETLEVHNRIFPVNETRICDLFERMKKILDENARIYRYVGDNVVYIENIWQRFKEEYPDFSNPPADVLEIIDKLCEYLCNIVYRCSLVTIPPRVKDHLSTLRVGNTLDFYDTFKDEVCSRENADSILVYLSKHPAFIHGIVDCTEGVIYRVDPRKSWRGYGIIAASIVFGGLISAVALTLYLREGKLSVSLLAPFLELYVIVFFGALIHIAVDALKEIRSGQSHRFKALDDIFLWIQVKQLPIIAGIGVLCIGFVMLIATVTDLGTMPITAQNMLTVFIAGYSIDSLGDLFIARFETVAGTKGEELKKALSLSESKSP